MSVAITTAERGWIPDFLVRVGIRALLRNRLAAERAKCQGDIVTAVERHLATMQASPIAVSTLSANTQHYEVPTDFFKLVLGPHLKYSCSFWFDEKKSLAQAETETLEVTASRADIHAGMRVLELGCGWGSLSLWIAERYPTVKITAVSNSEEQRRHIETQRNLRNLVNLEVSTADMNHFSPDGTFDRIVSIEMFEHMRNYEHLISRITSWLRPNGALFVHLFCHHQLCYFFQVEDKTDWMAHHFFTGGMMPSEDLLPRCRGTLTLEHQWRVSGREYQRTAQAWLANLDEHRREVEQVLAAAGSQNVRIDVERWRLFFLACAELFGYAAGNEWFVAHYRFRLGDVSQ